MVRVPVVLTELQNPGLSGWTTKTAYAESFEMEGRIA